MYNIILDDSLAICEKPFKFVILNSPSKRQIDLACEFEPPFELWGDSVVATFSEDTPDDKILEYLKETESGKEDGQDL